MSVSILTCQSASTELDALRTGRNGHSLSASVQVHSVFRRACNLVLRQEDRLMEEFVPEGLVTVAASELGNLPNGISVLLAPEFDLSAKIGAGQRGGFEGGMLRTPSLTLSLDGAARWNPSLAILRREVRHSAGEGESWRDRWTLAWRTLEAEGTASSLSHVARGEAKKGLPGSLVGTVREGIQQILEGCVRFDIDLATRGVNALIGLGLGLTPSGDDLLVGLLAGLWCYPASDHQQAFLENFSTAVVAASGHTTDVSRAYLKWAARGCVAQRLYDLAGAIVRPSSPDRGAHLKRQVYRLARQALAVGSTSGADGVYGLLLGLAAWADAGGIT
jgi:hypothetical protein